jgi:hypothetical protein
LNQLDGVIGGINIWAWYGKGVFYWCPLTVKIILLLRGEDTISLIIFWGLSARLFLGWNIGVLCSWDADITFKANYCCEEIFRFDLIDERKTSSLLSKAPKDEDLFKVKNSSLIYV